MDDLDVLLVLPPMYHSGRVPDYNPKEPLGLMYIDACLKSVGYASEIIDGDILALTIDNTVSEIAKKEPVVIGFSVMQRALPSVKKIVERLRLLGVASHICCGGFTATLSARHILQQIPGIDSIVLGDGEITFTNLVRLIKNNADWETLPGIAFKKNENVVINEPSEKPDLSLLPWPNRELLGTCFEKSGYATILASRGCYGVCTFCSNQAFERASIGSNWRGRNPVDVVDEIDQIRSSFDIKVFKFNDPNLFGPGINGRQHVVDICNELSKRNINDLHLMGFCRSNDIDMEIAQLMRQVGFERMLIGIESTNPAVLKFFRKGETIQIIRCSIEIFRQVGIDIVPGFMIFNPYTTIETLEIDLDFLDEYGFMPTLAKSLRIFDGTPLQEIMAAKGRLLWRNPFDGYHEYIVDPIIASIYMALKTVSVEWIDEIRKTYQEKIWVIKKAPTFKQRLDFDILSKLILEAEKGFLRSIISWVKSGFSQASIVSQVSELKKRLLKLENHILSASGLKDPVLDVESFSVSDLSGRVGSILTNKVFRTFPEQYRWKDD